ncbi:MAG: rRNA pseudouridine synthase [Patescibacteria group bacterium]|nr:rRNA pseudouridine synthase [Patescibacteria group bacterium]
MRIQKYLSQKKILSRRETEDYIRKGLIACNGEIVRDLGRQIDPEKDKIEILAPAKNEISKKITIAINKPRGIVCSRNKSEGKTIFELFPEFEKLNAVGRLDKESEGLILLSNDGVITSAITGSEHKIEKEYEVVVREDLNKIKMGILEKGVMIDARMTLPAKTKIIGDHTFNIILKEGRKHQIRRMADTVRLTILKLKRIRIGNITLKDLKVGNYRTLSVAEINKLKDLSK